MTAIESELPLFSACADWPVHTKPSGRPKKPAKSTRPVPDAQPITASVPIVIAAPAVVTSSEPPHERQWVQYVQRFCWWLFRRLWRYLGEVFNETARRIGVGLLLLLLAWLGFKNLDYEKSPEPKPPLTVDNSNNHWTTTVKPEPKNPTRK